MPQIKQIGNIVLVGFMGVGKSAAGKVCAQKMAWRFVDTDEEVEKVAGCSIEEIFAVSGEKTFRSIESQVIQRVLADGRQIVATGGGIVVAEENRRLLAAKRLQGSVVVWLQASAEVIWERVKHNKTRPLLNDPDPLAKVSALLSQRLSLYRAVADYEIDTSHLTVANTADSVIKLVRQ